MNAMKLAQKNVSQSTIGVAAMGKRLLLNIALVSALFAPTFASAAAAWYDIKFTGVDIWTYSADNAAQAPIDQTAPRRYRDFTQNEQPIQATMYGIDGGTASTVANLGFNSLFGPLGAQNTFAFDSINLWGAGGAAAAAWGESYVSVGNSDPLPGVSSWNVIQAPTGWTFGIVEGGQPYSADATHAFPVWRSGTGEALSQANMNDPSFVFEFQVLADSAAFTPDGKLRVFFGGFSDDLQGTGPDNYEVSGVMLLAPVPEPEIYAMMAAGLSLLGWVGRRRKLQTAA